MSNSETKDKNYRDWDHTDRDYYIHYFQYYAEKYFQIYEYYKVKYFPIINYIFSKFIITWLCSTNHKFIALLYFYFSLITGFVGTMLSMLIKLELSTPGDFYLWVISII